jgi:hypothetical protein
VLKTKHFTELPKLKIFLKGNKIFSDLQLETPRTNPNQDKQVFVTIVMNQAISKEIVLYLKSLKITHIINIITHSTKVHTNKIVTVYQKVTEVTTKVPKWETRETSSS